MIFAPSVFHCTCSESRFMRSSVSSVSSSAVAFSARLCSSTMVFFCSYSAFVASSASSTRASSSCEASRVESCLCLRAARRCSISSLLELLQAVATSAKAIVAMSNRCCLILQLFRDSPRKIRTAYLGTKLIKKRLNAKNNLFFCLKVRNFAPSKELYT